MGNTNVGTRTLIRHLSCGSAILRRPTGSQKPAGSILVWGSKIVFQKFEWDQRQHIVLDITWLPHALLPLN